MSNGKPQYLTVEQTVDYIIKEFGPNLSIGMPLGLGKPTKLINTLYNRVKADASLTLTIFTALSFEKPIPKSDLEARLITPFAERQWKGVPDLDYQTDLRAGTLPDRVSISESYAKAGSTKGMERMQQDYMSSNYTHSVRDINSVGNRVFAHSIAKRQTGDGLVYSCSCNADTSLEAIRGFQEMKKEGIKTLNIGMVNSYLPFMFGDAVLKPEEYDILIDDPDAYHPLFATPRMAVSVPEFMIGLHVSTLIKDSGTLQIGIGALGDSIAYGLNIRHNKNDAYKKLLNDSGVYEEYKDLIDEVGGIDVFEDGIYGSTEMLVDGFLQLYRNGVVKRKVYHHVGIMKLINDGKLKEDIPKNILSLLIENEGLHPYLTHKEFDVLQKFGVLKESLSYDNGQIVDGSTRYSALLADENNLKAVSENCLGDKLKNGVVLTGGFFLGPQDFYDFLNEISDEERMQFEMTGVEVANQLYGGEELRALERKNGRFCNTGMKVTLLGAIVSDGLEDGTVVSGVGGQYNFVSMAHALKDGRCVMMIKSTRTEGTKVLSNIIYNYGHTTIPRHLKDIVVTEYGIANIRGLRDKDVIMELLKVTDSRFQEELLAEAKKYKKVPQDYEIPEKYKHNTPEKLVKIMAVPKAQGLFPDFPCGPPMEPVELAVAGALKILGAKAKTPEAAKFPEMMQALPNEIPEGLKPMFARMKLDAPASREEVISQKTLLLAFRLMGLC
ncbi:MAG: hypothetical protein KKE62_04890 [Proteobacteria bacterium]|nr:hypothetical protein [Pseudomonadota bacterium]MBU1388099.1 hypothetical protein [Pseudomonadota bacterium]MBU1542163.1 hypothetical protein [Pseudomonadota bacterium]MBU2481681.1 hypothetical protein [Pseudomonadota bacterium]